MICSKCGATVPDGWPSCLDCGAPMADGSGAQGVEADVFPELAAANLNRVRGQYQDAEKRCVEILRTFPNNPAAHSLLGEIYEDQGRYADAITWYQLALELDPTSETDRSLLTRAMQRQAAAEQREEPMAASSQRFGWPPSLSMFSSPWIAPAALALVCLGLLCYIVVLLRAHAHLTEAAGAPGTAGSASIGAVAPAGVGSTGAASNPAETGAEQALQGTMNGARFRGVPAYSITSVMMDPRFKGYARVTATLVQPLSGQDARTPVLQVAGAAARAAVSANLNSITLRIVGQMGNTSPALLFVAEANLPAFTGVTPSTLTNPDSVDLFQNVWWSQYTP